MKVPSEALIRLRAAIAPKKRYTPGQRRVKSRENMVKLLEDMEIKARMKKFREDRERKKGIEEDL